MQIPLVDLAWQHRRVAASVEAGWREILESTGFILGRNGAAFEEDFAGFCGVSHCVGVANGTDAIELALRAADIGRGARVVVPANTFVATAEAVVRAGAAPVFVDCAPQTYLLDLDATVAAMDSAEAVVAVHLYGQQAPMEQLQAAAAERGCVVIEDGAQAQGALRHGRGLGAWSVAAATSFYPGKNLGAYGDAGAIVTDDADCATRLRNLANHGTRTKHGPRTLGFNSRLDELQAVVLSAKLAELKAWNDLRREAADRYQALLRDEARVQLPVEAEGNTHVWHLFVVQVPARDQVLERLHSVGIQAGIHYPVPVHLEEPFLEFGGGSGSMPVAEAAAVRLLSLPIYPGITPSQQERVAEELGLALDAYR